MAKNTDKSIESGSEMPNEDIENHGVKIEPVKDSVEKPNPETMEVTVTEEILKLNPEMAAEGIKVGDKFEVNIEETQEDTPTEDELKEAGFNKIDDSTLAKLAKYSKLYPQSKSFHITSDGQVFLEKSLNDAKNHQKGLENGELKTYRV